MSEKSYLFTITLRGYGETEQDAWDNALEGFVQDPGCPDDATVELEGEVD